MEDIAGLVERISARLDGLRDPQRDIPRAAKIPEVVQLVEEAARRWPTSHQIRVEDARDYLPIPGAIHLALTSPPYWTLKRYAEMPGQLGHLGDYDEFLNELDRVWTKVFDALVPGGRLVCVVGDVCLSRRLHGRHQVVALHASIQERCRSIGFDNLAPIFWHKITNAKHEVERGGGFLGKPYEPNAVIKNDVEYILMFRKPGGYRAPSTETRLLSLIPEVDHKRWFRQIWTDLAGASTRDHPAPFPIALAERLVRMFSFVGDTVLDPFTGTGTTNLAAALWGRNSIGIEVDPGYARAASERIAREVLNRDLPAQVSGPTDLIAVPMAPSVSPQADIAEPTRDVSAA